MRRLDLRTESERRLNDTIEDEEQADKSNAADLLLKIRNRHQKIKAEMMATQDTTDQDDTPRSNENESYSMRRLVPSVTDTNENGNTLTVPKGIRRNGNRRNRSAGDTVVNTAVKRMVTYDDDGIAGRVNEGFESDKEVQKADEPATGSQSESKRAPKPRRPRNRNQKTGQDAVNQTETAPSQPVTSFEDTLITAVIVHQSDRLRTDINIYHPIVKVHVLDLGMDGQYLKKSNK